MEVASFLSLIKGFDFRWGRRDGCVWSPNPVAGFFCKSFSRILVDPSPIIESAFDVLWRIKISKKVRFFVWQVFAWSCEYNRQGFKKVAFVNGSILLHFLLRGGKPGSLSLRVSIREINMHFFLPWVLYFVCLSKGRSFDNSGIPFSSAFQRERVFSLVLWSVLWFGIYGARETVIGCSPFRGVEMDPCEVWFLMRSYVSLWALTEGLL